MRFFDTFAVNCHTKTGTCQGLNYSPGSEPHIFGTKVIDKKVRSENSLAPFKLNPSLPASDTHFFHILSVNGMAPTIRRLSEITMITSVTAVTPVR